MKKGSKMTDVSKKKISDALKGKKGKPLSETTKKRMSEAHTGVKLKPLSKEHKKKISDAKKGKPSPNKGKKFSEEHKKRLSAGQQGISYDEWESFACESKYCPKFDEACRESNREKYGRECFICGKSEKANGQKLSVHHVDMDKAQGCESNWKLVPLCKSCHSSAHNDELIARLGYLIKEE